MKWHVYDVIPIDFGWQYLPTVAQTAERLGAEDGRMRVTGQDHYSGDVTLDAFIDAWNSAKDAANQHGWAGDFRQDPVVFWVPVENEFTFGFVIKQDNNGTTFVVSPVALPHLVGL